MTDAIDLAYGAIEPTRSKSRFFPIAAGVILLIAFIGFSRTFYLRALVDTSSLAGRQELPGFVVLHGLIFTSWVLLFAAQSWLGAFGKLRVHRKLGVAGAFIAAAVVSSGLYVTLHQLPEMIEAGGALFSVIVLHNVISMVSFAAFVALAVYWRRKGASHKRLMFYATLSMLGPALSPGDRPFGEFLVQFVPLPDATVIGCLIIALCTKDLFGEGRLHKVTLWGGAVVAAKYVLVGIVLFNETAQSALLRVL